MAESVSTGGNVQFQYQRGHKPKASKEYQMEIEGAYNEYYQRRKREKKRRFWIWVVIIILILLALGIWWFSRN